MARLLPQSLSARLGQFASFFSLAWLVLLGACAHSPETAAPGGPATHARFVPERMDDFAWENDRIAFRAYGPALRESSEDSGFDAWLKRVSYPIVDKWYAAHLSGQSYHVDHGEGYDPYKVGASRGCGGLGLWLDEQWVTSNVFTGWEILHSTPELTRFVLHYEWEHEGDRYTEAKEISIRLGDPLFRATSTFRKNGALAPGLPVAIGLVLHHEADRVLKDPDAGWMAVWEELDGAGLGTGVVIDAERIEDIFVQTGPGELDDHAVLLTRSDARAQVDYYAGYGWARAGVILTPEDWTRYLHDFAKGR